LIILIANIHQIFIPIQNATQSANFAAGSGLTYWQKDQLLEICSVAAVRQANHSGKG